MKRKNWVRLLSILAALMLPLTAMAQSSSMDMLSQARADGKEIVTTVSFVPGGMISGDQMVTDLSNVTALRFSGLKGGYGAFALVLNGVDVVAAQLRAQTDGLYVQSETLGDKPLYFSWEDVNKGLTSAMESSGTDAATMKQFSESMSMYIDKLSTMDWENATVTSDAEPKTEEEIKQKIAEAMGGDTSLVDWINGIEAKAVVTSGEFTLNDSDKADTKTEYKLDKNDFAAFYDNEYMLNQMAEQIKAGDSSLTEEEVQKQAQDSMKQVQQAMIDSDIQMDMTVYTSADEFVALEMKMSAMVDPTTVDETKAELSGNTVVAEESKLVPFTMDGQLTLKTTGDQKDYQLMATVTKDSANVAYVDGSFTYDNEKAEANLSVLDDQSSPVLTLAYTGNYANEALKTGDLEGTIYADGTSYAFMLNTEKATQDQSIDLSIKLAFATNLEDIKATPDTYTLGTLKFNMAAQEDSGTFNGLKEATPATSLEVLKLSQDELNTYLTKLQFNAYGLLSTLYSNLPASVAEQFSSSMSGN